MPPDALPITGSAYDTKTSAGGPLESYQGQLAERRADYQKLGREEAANHRPPSDAVNSDQHEVDLISQANRLLAEQKHFVTFATRTATQAASSIQDEVDRWISECNLTLSSGSFDAEVRTELVAERDSLIERLEDRYRKDVALRSFRARQGIPLDAVAKYPESRLQHFQWLFMGLVAEALANAVFYQNDQGLIGGTVIALMVAVVNIGIATGLGWASRYRNTRDGLSRALGWIALIAFPFWTLFTNSLFALFRSAYQATDPDNSGALSAAFVHSLEGARGIFTLSLHLSDFESFILFGLGFLLSFYAFYEGMTCDDKYPGHSDLDKAVKRSAALEKECSNRISSRLRDFLDKTQSQVQALLTEPARVTALLVTHETQLAQDGALFEARQDHIQRDFITVLQSYRDANLVIRATRPPKYFDSQPALASSTPGVEYDLVRKRLKEMRQAVATLRKEYEPRIQERISEMRTVALAALSDGLSICRKSASDEAQQRINRDLQITGRTVQ